VVSQSIVVQAAVTHCDSGADWISPCEIDYNLVDVEKSRMELRTEDALERNEKWGK
jgi:hypothetical protein